MESKVQSEVSEADRERVYAWLREYNHAENGAFMEQWADGAEKEVFLVLRDAAGDVIGGLSGCTLFRWLKIQIMAVHPTHRGQGVGRNLIEAAEDLARERGCTHAYVDTMSYQSPVFYNKVGYTECGRLPDWDSHGHDKLFFMKEL